MSNFNVEVGFLSKLIETKDLKAIKDLQIKPEFFTGEHKQLFNFIQDFYLKNGEMPTVRAVEQYFPSYKFEYFNDSVGTEEGLTYWANELRRKAKHNRLADALEEGAKCVDAFKTDEAFALLKKEIVFIESELTATRNIDITKDTESRIESYLKRKENQGMLGIPTGIQHLDNLLRGLEKETLTIFIAKTGVGKTFLEVLIGAYCMLNGYRVLQVVTEMSDAIMRDRYEAMLFGMMYGNFNYNHFKGGKLDKETEEQYFHFLRNDLPKLEPLTLQPASGVISIGAEIDSLKPDIVLIDGMYLLEDDRGAKEDWLRLTHITRDLKMLCKDRKLPFVANTQTDIKGRETPGLADVKYAQAINQDADNVIAMYRDEVMFNDNEMGLKVQKQREGILGKVVINWDFTTMDFSGIYSEQAEESVSKEENKNVIGIGD